MKDIALIALLSGLVFNLSCGGSSGGSSDSGTTVTSEVDITAAIATGDYTSWFGHESVQGPQGNSPHSQMKTFLNDTLKASVDAQNTEHPVGSISIKELYNNDGSEITGYAYSEKVAAGTDADTWLWYEDLNLSNPEASYYGVGISTCRGCHSSGTDYVRIVF